MNNLLKTPYGQLSQEIFNSLNEAEQSWLSFVEKQKRICEICGEEATTRINHENQTNEPACEQCKAEFERVRAFAEDTGMK